MVVFRERCKLNQPADLWGASGPSSVSGEHATIVTRGSCMHVLPAVTKNLIPTPTYPPAHAPQEPHPCSGCQMM